MQHGRETMVAQAQRIVGMLKQAIAGHRKLYGGEGERTLPFLALLLPFCQRLMPLLVVLQR